MKGIEMPNIYTAPDSDPEGQDADTEVQAVAEALREIVAADGSRTGEAIAAIDQAADLLELLSA